MNERARDMQAGSTALPENRAGCAMWWSATLIEVDPIALRMAMMLAAPRYVDLVREPVGPHTAMRRAIRRCSAGVPTGFMWREVGVDKTPALTPGSQAAVPEQELVIAYAREHNDTQRRVYEAKDEWTLTVNDRTGVVLPSIPTSQIPRDQIEQLDRVLERYHKERMMLTQQDVRAIMLRIFLGDAQGIRLKQTGAIYFLPSTPIPLRDADGNKVEENGHVVLRPADAIIDEMAPVLAEAGVSLLRLPILSSDAATISQISGPARQSILDEIEEMRLDAEKRIASFKEGKGRVSTLQARLEEAAALRQKARVYRDLLGLGLGDAERSLSLAEEMIQAAMADAERSLGVSP